MASMLTRLTRIGIEDGFSPKKVKEYQLANSYTLSAIGLMAINAIIQSAFGLIGAGLGCVVALLMLSASFLFTARQQVFKAEILAMAANYTGITTAVILYGEAYMNHVYYVLLVIACVVIFGPKRSGARNVAIAATLVLLFLSFFSGSGILGTPTSGEFGQWIISRFNILLVSSAMLFFFYISVVQNRVAEKRLSAAAKKADRERQLKTQFLSLMSHEIRTPLNGILGVGHLLSTSRSPDEIEENLRILNNSGQLLLSLINDVLDFNKLEAGKIEVNLREFNLEEVVKDTFNVFASRASEKGIAYELNFDPQISQTLIGDRARISQVLSNLLSNAIKFTEDGSVALYIRHQETVDDQQTIEFEVVDEGIGIEEEKQDDIFQEFQQADRSTASAYGGSGLGLAICKKIVALLGGEIQVRSIPEVGSSFNFTLTMDIVPAETSVETSSGALGLSQLQKSRILLVEDNAVNRIIMRKLLEQWQVSHQMATNGQEALDLLEAQSVDLILMDIQMPVMDGITATRHIRAGHGSQQQIPIIALTADVTKQVREEAEEAGVNALITKPFDPKELQKILLRHLSAPIDA